MGSDLPPVLREIAEVAGEVAAVAIAARVGGTRVYIPAHVSDRHWLVECVGRRAADLICAHYAVDQKRGTRIDVPMAEAGAYKQFRRTIAQRVHQLDREGASSSEIATRIGITQRAVHRHRSAHRGQQKTSSKQGRLL